MTTDEHRDDAHAPGDDWGAWAAQAELEGETLLTFVTDTASWLAELRGAASPPVRRIIDIGSGPGVGTCELARLFPHAHVLAVDASPAMLERTMSRAATHGLAGRVSAQLAELPDGLEGMPPADIVWASLALHHVGDEVGALRALRRLLAPGGLVALAELADPMRVLPDPLDVGPPGLARRLNEAWTRRFAAMRAALADSVPSTDLDAMAVRAGYEVVGSRVARLRLDPPLAHGARTMVQGRLRRLQEHLAADLAHDDVRALDVLVDPDDPRGVMQRADVFVADSRRILIARPRQDG